jgi:glycosyltransferase involved in cell wall biosynthesis
MFRITENGTYGLPSCADPFFQKYLEVFDSVQVLGNPVRDYIDTSALVKMTDPRISVRITPNNAMPQDFKNDKVIVRVLREEISKAEAILVKPTNRKGIIALKLAEELKKPYMIDVTGDIHNALKQHPSFLKRLYAPILYRQIKNAIKKCQFGLYVSKDYLQQQYPIAGEQCGCSDVVLEPACQEVLEKRIKKIQNHASTDKFEIALIGFYQGKMKGVDTAIRALAKLPSNFHLNILGNGTQENREHWFKYAAELGMDAPHERISFPTPLPNATAVLNWLDTQDFFVLPTRSEGFGRCVAEAMSRGCVCFATDICTMPELLEQECLHPLDDDATLKSLIETYAGDKDKMIANAKRNFDKAKEYDFEVLRTRRNAFLEKFKAYCEQQK